MHLMHHQILAPETMQIQQQQHHQQQPQAQVTQAINHHQHHHHHQQQHHHQQHHQHQQHQQQQQQPQPNDDQQHLSAPSMTVLETLEPVLSVLDPVVQQQHHNQQQQQQQDPSPIHGLHLVQAPQLHQLQAPSRNQLEQQQRQQQQQQMDSSEPIGEPNNDNNLDASNSHSEQAPATGANGGLRSSGRQSLQQQRSHIEGIVADGGGPIVQWLLDNYEIADGESLPRSTVYNHYLAHCRHLQMASVNAASFGKLIRSVFIGLKTRRLGTRGHSKYHYFGVRAKQHVRLDWLQEAADGGELGGGGSAPAGCSAHEMANENSNQNTDNGSESPDSTGDEHHSNHNSSSSHKRLRRHHHFTTTTTTTTSNNNNNSHQHHHHTRRSNTCGSVAPNDGDNYGHQLDAQQQQQQPQPHQQHQQQLHHNHLQHQQQLQLHHHQHSQHNNQINPHSHSNDQMLEHLRHQQASANGYYYTNTCSPGQLQPENGYNCVQQQIQEGTNMASGAGPKLDSNGINPLGDRFARPNWPPSNHDELAAYRSHLAPNWSTLVDEHWPQSNINDLGQQQQQVWDIFENSYKQCYKRMLELLNELKFADVERLWFDFWHPAGSRAEPGELSSPPTATANLTTGTGSMAQGQTVGGQQLMVANQPTTVHWTAGSGQQQQQEASIRNDGQQHVELVVQRQDQLDGKPRVNPLHHHNSQHGQNHHQHHQPPPSEDHLYQATEHHHQVVVLENVGENAGQQQQHMQPNQRLSNAGLGLDQLYQLTSQPGAIERVNQIDYCLYAALEFFLVPELLEPLPRPLAQQLRMFAKCFGPWMESATRDYGLQFSSEKSQSARAFGHALRRYTSINHLATASRAVWDRRSVLAQMSLDLSGLDLRDIEHQVSLMSQAKLDGSMASTRNMEQSVVANDNVDLNVPEGQRSHLIAAGGEQQQQHQPQDNTAANNNENAAMDTVIHPGQRQFGDQNHTHEQQHHESGDRNQTPTHNHHNQNKTDQLRQTCPIQPAQLIQNFLHLLQDPYPADNWPAWCRNLAQYCGHSVDDARNFILKWNFYISLIMKELTLKSAPSLGSFQLIRLLFDEYIYYLVASKLARAQNKTFAQLLQASRGLDGV